MSLSASIHFAVHQTSPKIVPRCECHPADDHVIHTCHALNAEDPNQSD